ncbi:eukaryotic translation initiation factor 4B isoform X2 [Sigmodon hispidus]
MPAPPTKENAWVKRSANPPARSQSSDTEQQSPTSGGKVAPVHPSEDGPSRKHDSKIEGVSIPKGQSGNSSRGPGDGGNKDHWKEMDRKDGKKDQDSRPARRPKKSEENPASKFSSASKYAALSVDGEDENEDDHTE